MLVDNIYRVQIVNEVGRVLFSKTFRQRKLKMVRDAIDGMI